MRIYSNNTNEILPTLRYASGGVSLLSASQRITSASSIHPRPNRRGILEISDKDTNRCESIS